MDVLYGGRTFQFWMDQGLDPIQAGMQPDSPAYAVVDLITPAHSASAALSQAVKAGTLTQTLIDETSATYAAVPIFDFYAGVADGSFFLLPAQFKLLLSNANLAVSPGEFAAFSTQVQAWARANPQLFMVQILAHRNPANHDLASIGAEGGYAALNAIAVGANGLDYSRAQYLTVHAGNALGMGLLVLAGIAAAFMTGGASLTVFGAATDTAVAAGATAAETLAVSQATAAAVAAGATAAEVPAIVATSMSIDAATAADAAAALQASVATWMDAPVLPDVPLASDVSTLPTSALQNLTTTPPGTSSLMQSLTTTKTATSAISGAMSLIKALTGAKVPVNPQTGQAYAPGAIDPATGQPYTIAQSAAISPVLLIGGVLLIALVARR